MTIETVSERKKYVDYFTDYETVRKSLFLGQPLGLLENLRNEFPEIWAFYKQLKNLDWEESELPVKSCKQEFLVHDPEVTDLMRKTLAFQYEGDTSASQIAKLMYPFITNTELFSYITELTKNEIVHSLSYKFIVENCFDNPLEFLEYVKSLESAFRRLSAVQRVFEEIYQLGIEYQTGNVSDENVIRKALLKFWATLYCLERIQFIASFAITFGLAENNYFVPIGKLVQKIATDEFQIHVQADKAILKNELSIPETFALFLEIAPEISEIIHEVTMSEITWLEEELFRDKKVIAGIYHEKIKKTVIYASQEVYQFFGIESPFEHLFENPLPSMDEWLVIDNNQASPQEEATGNYLLGGFVDDRDTLDIFKKYPMITSGASLERFAL